MIDVFLQTHSKPLRRFARVVVRSVIVDDLFLRGDRSFFCFAAITGLYRDANRLRYRSRERETGITRQLNSSRKGGGRGGNGRLPCRDPSLAILDSIFT